MERQKSRILQDCIYVRQDYSAKQQCSLQVRLTVRKQARNEEVTANAKSVLSVLGACIKSGDEIEVICEGSDETAALAEMIRIIEDGRGKNKG